MNLYTTKKSGIHNVLLVMDRSGDQVTDTKTQHLGIGRQESGILDHVRPHQLWKLPITTVIFLGLYDDYCYVRSRSPNSGWRQVS